MSDNSVDTEEATTSPPTSLNGVENAPEGTPSMATSVSPAPTGTLDSRTNEADGETLPLKRDKHPKYYKRKKMAEAFVFIGGIVVLWTLLAAAVVVYHIPTGSSDAAGNIDTVSLEWNALCIAYYAFLLCKVGYIVATLLKFNNEVLWLASKWLLTCCRVCVQQCLNQWSLAACVRTYMCAVCCTLSQPCMTHEVKAFMSAMPARCCSLASPHTHDFKHR